MSIIAAAMLCLVVGVTDGDTLTTRCGEPDAYQPIKVRLAEIDAPERKQSIGARSRKALADMCMNEQATVTPTWRGRYKRIVARVSCRGEDANAALVRAGLAWAYTKYLTDPTIAQLQQEARTAGRGLWIDERGVPPFAPWQWRANMRVFRDAVSGQAAARSFHIF